MVLAVQGYSDRGIFVPLITGSVLIEVKIEFRKKVALFIKFLETVIATIGHPELIVAVYR